ncbi:MAG: OmpA family protein [Burkholderiales bacterium]
MKRLRLEAICAGLAVGLAVSYGVLAHDFSALKDGTGNSVRAGSGGCVESSGTVIGGADCERTTATAAAPVTTADNAPAAMAEPAAMANKKEMMAENKDPMPTVAAGTAVAASSGVAASSVPNVKDGSGNAVRAGAGGCVESPGGSSGGCEPTAEPPATMAVTPAAPAPMADRQEPMDDRKAMTASATGGAATGDAGMGVATLADGRTINGPVGTATPGHLRDGSGKAVRSGFGGCINLGYSVNSPDHPIECEFQPMQSVAAAPAHESIPPAKPAPTPEPAPAAEPAPPVAAVTTPEPAPASAAREVPPAPPTVVPGTVRNTSPIGDGSESAAMAEAGAPDTSDEFPAKARTRSERGALVDDSQPQESGAMAQPSAPTQSAPGTVRNTGPAGETAAAEPTESQVSDLKDSPPPLPVPAPPTQITRRDSGSMDIPPPVRGSQDSGVAAAPSAPPADVPGTVRSTAPSGETSEPSGQTAAPSGDVQMPPAKPAPIPAPEYEKITLSADVLFKFDRYREKDMLKAGRAKLDDVADQINNYIKDTVELITLTGHTDRLGSDAYNQRLSERRAKTVKNYLVKKGIDGGKIADSGRGEREPVMQCKGNKATKKLIRCLQPNRRVDVEIRGTKQK